MFVKVKTINIEGIDIQNVDVEVHLSNGNPGLVIVGLGDKAIAESKDRIRSAIISLGLGLPAKRITVNLSPSDIHKEGSYYDLPILIGILCVMRILDTEAIKDYYFMGEIGLDGSIRKTNGVLVAAMHAAIENMNIVCPSENGAEATWAGEKVQIVAGKNILEIVNHFNLKNTLKRPEMSSIQNEHLLDMSDVKGQKKAKIALEIAAAGGHNILLIGSQGTGKSMLAQRINSILPRMNSKEILEVNMIQSVAGLIRDGKISTNRPFRAPHHSCSMPSLLGGGRNPIPGEITLSHRGVLFLDELPEYQRVVLDSLRQPIENKSVSIARVGYKVTYPANFQLVAAMNPCKCGHYGGKNGCTKQPECAKAYQAKISGPFMDRIDIKVEMQNQSFSTTFGTEEVIEKSSQIRQRVEMAREIQENRYKEYGIFTNSEATDSLIQEFCMPKDNSDLRLLEEIYEKLNLSMRGYYKMLKVARTIADLMQENDVKKHHILQAASYRADKMLI